MRKIFTIILLLLGMHAYSQKEMKKTELSSDFFLVDVQSGAERMFAVKYKGACIAYNKKNKEFLLYGDGDGTNIIFLEKIANVPLKFYPDKFVSCTYKDGKVYLASQVTNKATVITGVFNWKDEHLIWEKEESFDLSEQQVLRATNLVKNGKVMEALATYDSVQYAESYYDAQKAGIEMVLASQKSIEDYEGKHKFKESVDLMDKVLAFKGMKWMTDQKGETELKTTMGKGLYGLTYATLQRYIEVYSKHILEAKLNDKAIEKINFYWKYFTNSADLMLNYADAYYAKKDKTKASEYYVKYSNAMKQAKKEKDIPYYVPQRIIKE